MGYMENFQVRTNSSIQFMTRRSITFYFTAITIVAGCSNASTTPTSLFVGEPLAVQVVSDNSRVVTDELILSIVIADLLSYDGDDSFVEPPMDRPEKMFFDPSFSIFSPSDDTVLRKYTPEYWSAIQDIDHSVLIEATNNLRSRTKSAGTHRIELTDSRILIDDSSTDRSRVYDRPLRICLPGYSNTKNVCVVFVIVPWSMHHAEGTYILQKVNGRWILRLRQFVLFL